MSSLLRRLQESERTLAGWLKTLLLSCKHPKSPHRFCKKMFELWNVLDGEHGAVGKKLLSWTC
jgi:hypothetical protein